MDPQQEEFPILCETCLGENPFVRMAKIPYGQACKICEKPFTCYRWRPGPRARYKKTQLCRSCAKSKNVCQTCVLDLQYGLPVQVRDTAMEQHEREGMPVTQVNREYLQEVAENSLDADGSIQSYQKFTRPSLLLQRLQRRAPYYKRNAPHVCSFFVKGTCNRGKSCPFRHEMPVTGDLANQNIRDRYYGKNDPVAKKILKMSSQRQTPLVPPDDKTIRTLWVGGLEAKTGEADIRHKFSSFGELAHVKVARSKNCAFITFSTRSSAEAAASKVGTSGLYINGSKCRLAWGKKQASKRESKNSRSGVAVPPGMAAPPGMASKGPTAVPPPPGMSKAYYPSMDASHMGARFDTTHQEK
ncbi:hypothetical protein AAMO2058_000199100 [Amorphochlora amoebiformis]